MTDETDYSATRIDWDHVRGAAVRAASVTSIPLREPITYRADDGSQRIEAIGSHWLIDTREHHIEETYQRAVDTSHEHVFIVLLPSGLLKDVTVVVEMSKLLDEHGNRTATTFARSHRVTDLNDSSAARLDFPRQHSEGDEPPKRTWGNLFAPHQRPIVKRKGDGLLQALDRFADGAQPADLYPYIPSYFNTANVAPAPPTPSESPTDTSVSPTAGAKPASIGYSASGGAIRPGKAPNRRPSRKLIALVSAVLVACLIGAGTYGYLTHLESQQSIDFAEGLTLIDTVPVGQAPHGVAVDTGAQFAYVANTADDTVSVVDLSARKQVATIPIVGQPASVGLDAEARILFVGTRSGIAVVDIDNRSFVHTISPLGDFVVDSRTHTIWIYSWERSTTQVLDTRTRETRFTVSHDMHPGGVAVDSATGRAYLATGNTDPYLMWVIDATSGTLLEKFPIAHVGWGLITGDPGMLYSAGGGSSDLHVVNVAAQTSYDIAGRNNMYNLAFDRGTRLVYATSAYDNLITVIDPAKQTVLRQIDATNPEDIAVDSDRQLIYVTNNKSPTLTIIGQT